MEDMTQLGITNGRTKARASSSTRAIVSMAALVAAMSLAPGIRAESAPAEHEARPHGAAAEQHAGAAHEFNWYYGFLGEDAEAEHPSVAYRLPGMPVPFLAYLINTAVLFYGLYRFGKGPVAEGLKKRRAAIMDGMQQAARMKAEATEQLAQYQAKLDSVDSDIERIKRDMREAAELEREGILAAARERKVRMSYEATRLLEQEQKAMQQTLIQQMTRGAAETARELLLTQVVSSDHQRMSEAYLSDLDSLLLGLKQGRGGQA